MRACQSTVCRPIRNQGFLLYKSWRKHWSCCSLWCCGSFLRLHSFTTCPFIQPFGQSLVLRAWLENGLIAVVARARADLFRPLSTRWSGWAMDIQLKPITAETSSSQEIMVWHWLCTNSVRLQYLIKATIFAIHRITGSSLQKTFANFATKFFCASSRTSALPRPVHDLFSTSHYHANLLTEC